MPVDLLGAMRDAGVIDDTDTPDSIQQKTRDLLTEAGWKPHHIDRMSGRVYVDAMRKSAPEQLGQTANPDVYFQQGVTQDLEKAPLGLGKPVIALRGAGEGAYGVINRGAAMLANLAGDQDAVNQMRTSERETQQAMHGGGLTADVGRIGGAILPMMAGGALGAGVLGTLQGGGRESLRGGNQWQSLKAGVGEGVLSAATAGIGAKLAGAAPALGRALGVGALEGTGFGIAPMAGEMAAGHAPEGSLKDVALSAAFGAATRGTLRGIEMAGEQKQRQAAHAADIQQAASDQTLIDQAQGREQAAAIGPRPEMPNPLDIQAQLAANTKHAAEKAGAFQEAAAQRAAIDEHIRRQSVASTIDENADARTAAELAAAQEAAHVPQAQPVAPEIPAQPAPPREAPAPQAPVAPAPKEVAHASEVRSDQGQAAPQGVQPTSRENGGSPDIQQPAQVESKAGYRQGLEPGAPKETVLADNGKIRLTTDGIKMYANGKPAGDMSRRNADKFMKTYGLTPKPTGEVRPTKEVTPEVTELPAGESKPIKPAEPPVPGEGVLRHTDVQHAGLPVDVAKSVVGTGRAVWGDMADRLRGLGATELADRVAATSRRAKELIGETGAKMTALMKGANAESRAVSAAMKPNAQGRSVFLDAVEGRIPVPQPIRRAVEAVWESNRVTADWFRQANLTRADGTPFVGFNQGRGMVRHTTPEMDALMAGRYGEPAKQAFIDDLARRNQKTPDEIRAILEDKSSFTDTSGSVRRDPMEFARALRDFPQYTTLPGGRQIPLLDVDPTRYVGSLTNHAANRVAFAERFGQKFDIGGDIQAQLKTQGITDPNVLGAMENAVRALHGKDVVQRPGDVHDKIGTAVQSAVHPAIEQTVRRLTSAAVSVGKTANLTMSPISNIAGAIGNMGSVPLRHLVKGVVDATIHPRQSSRAAAAEGSVLPELYRFFDTAGMPETVTNIVNSTIGVPARLANKWAALSSANAGRSWVEAMSKRTSADVMDVTRLKALGFNEAEATNIASGKATPQMQKQVIREMVTATNAVNATRAQQSVLQNYGVFRRFGPAFATFAEQQARNFTRVADLALAPGAAPAQRVAATRMLLEKFLGLTAAGTGAVLATAYLRGGESGVKQQTDNPKTLLVDALFKGVIGGTGQMAATAFEKLSQPGPSKVTEWVRLASYPAGKVLDIADAFDTASGESAPYTQFALSQAPGAKIARDLIGWASAERTPERSMALQKYWKWAVANPDESGFSGGSEPTPLSIPVNKLAKALADGDKPRVAALIKKSLEGSVEVATEKAMATGSVPKKIGPEAVGAALDARRPLKSIYDVDTGKLLKPKSFVSLRQAVGPEVMRQLLLNEMYMSAAASALK